MISLDISDQGLIVIVMKLIRVNKPDLFGSNNFFELQILIKMSKKIRR